MKKVSINIGNAIELVLEGDTLRVNVKREATENLEVTFSNTIEVAGSAATPCEPARNIPENIPTSGECLSGQAETMPEDAEFVARGGARRGRERVADGDKYTWRDKPESKVTNDKGETAAELEPPKESDNPYVRAVEAFIRQSTLTVWGIPELIGWVKRSRPEIINPETTKRLNKAIKELVEKGAISVDVKAQGRRLARYRHATVAAAKADPHEARPRYSGEQGALNHYKTGTARM